MPWQPRWEDDVCSLGWGIVEDLESVLPSPADELQALRYTPEQLHLLIEWWRIDPVSGEFVYRRCCCEMCKGWGKSPLWASVGIAELALPVLFDGWDANGQPARRPWGWGDSPPAWVQIAAVSEDQTDNTYAALYELLTANDGRAAQALGIDEGRTRLYLRGRPGRLEPVTASAGSREGQRVTFAVLDETHLWTQRNRGVVLAKTIRRNAAKMSGRTIETTNAPELGEKSVAETSGADAEQGEPGILFYARRPVEEPDPSWDDERLLAILDEVYGDARWIDRRRILKEIRDPATPWEDSLRFYFNLRMAGAGRAVDPRMWDALARPQDVPAGTEVGLGFDGSISRDATVLRACTREGYSFLLGAWVPPKGDPDWKVPRADVHQAVAEAFARFRVGRMLCDPPKWWSEIEDWTALYGEEVVVALDTNQARRFAPAVDRWLTGLREGTHTHDGDPITTEHVKAAQRKKVRLADLEDDDHTMYVLVKGESGRRIDGAVADVLAYEAAQSMPEMPRMAKPTFIGA